MGCCSSNNNNAGLPADERVRNKNAHTEIQSSMKGAERIDRGVKKLLLLGTGSSGKSTLFKSLKKVNNKQDDSVLGESRHVIRQNIIAGILTLLKKSQELYDEDQDNNGACLVNMDDNIVGCIQQVVNHGNESFTEALDYSEVVKLGQSVYKLWKLDPVQATFARRGNKYSFPDNMDYFFDKVEEIMTENYYPTQQDMLRARVRTTGIVHMEYKEKDHSFIIYDVGGQRNERKKWIHQFESVAAVLFVTALNHYHAVLFEDEKKNAMHEAIELFTEICKSKWFNKSEMILFLNKDDLFRQKLLSQIPLDVCFNEQRGWAGKQWNGPNYQQTGDDDADNQSFQETHQAACQFIQNRFIDCTLQSRNPNRVVFCHVTCATDQGTVKKVFMDVQNIVIRSNLRRGGLMI